MFKIGDIIVDKMTNGQKNIYGVTSGKDFVGRVIATINDREPDGDGDEDEDEDEDGDIYVCVVKTREDQMFHIGEMYWVHSEYFKLQRPATKREVFTDRIKELI